MRRRGRKRKLGRRHPSGDLVLACVRESPAARARSLPHRRGLVDPVDQRAESELGRCVLRGDIAEAEGLAGVAYRRQWQRYMASICAPRALRVGSGRAFACQRCGDFCICALRKRQWQEVRSVLAETGATLHVDAVCLFDRKLARADLWLIRLGLCVLARHFGLTAKTNSVLGNASSRLTPSPPAQV